MAARYWVGRGSPRWQDRRNWSRKSGGIPGADLPTVKDTIVIDVNSGSGEVNLFACPHGGLKISGFRGTVEMPSGGKINMAPPVEEEATV